jgi:hypothetical protein
MANDIVQKNIKDAENLLNIIKYRSQNCNSNIVYPLSDLRIIIDNLFKNYTDISKDRSLYRKFHEIIKWNDTYKGEFANNCKCVSKKKKYR